MLGNITRGTEGPVMTNCLPERARLEICRGALPEFDMCRVWLTVWPIATVLKLKLVAERAKAASDEDAGWYPAQPESMKAMTIAERP